MKYKIIVCDLDGTLLDGNANLSQENYDACASEKKHLCTIPDCGHGLAFLIDPEGYKKALKTFD